jgi:hypothetical protein
MYLHQIQLAKCAWLATCVDKPVVEQRHMRSFQVFESDLAEHFQQVTCVVTVASTSKCENPRLKTLVSRA